MSHSPKKLPFFSLLESKATVYHPYALGLFEQFYLWLARKTYQNHHLQLIAQLTVCLIVASPVLVAAFLFSIGGIASYIAGAVALYFGFQSLGTYKTYQAFHDYVTFKSTHSNLIPPDEPHPKFKTAKRSFNQVFSFFVDGNNQVWYALRESRYKAPVWKPLFIDGYQPDINRPVDIQADGPNFMMRVSKEEESTVFYKKTYEDKRENGKYIINNVIESPMSIKQWFSLPFISYLKPGTWNKLIKMNPFAKWLMSNSGTLRYIDKDRNGNWHPIWNCTTIYVQEGRSLIIYDPYVLPGTEVRVSLPPGVQVEQIAATSSRLFIYGVMVNENPQRSVLLERTIDYDAIGLNPLQRYTYDTQDTQKRLLPLDQIKEIPLPKEHITGNLCVIQTGEKENVEIFLETLINDSYGFYHKSLQDESWTLEKNTHEQELLLEPEIPMNPRQVFKAKDTIFNHVLFKEIKCKHFDKNAIDSEIDFIKHDGGVIRCYLHRSTSMVKAFIQGHCQYTWHLSLQPEAQTKENMAWLNGQVSVHVNVYEDETGLLLKSDQQSLNLSKSHTTKPLSFGQYNAKVLNNINRNEDLPKEHSIKLTVQP